MNLQSSFAYRLPRDTGLSLISRGISVLPVQGKRPAVRSWARFQAQIMPPQDFNAIMRSSPQLGIAIVAGEVSQNLVIVDLDGLEAVRRFRDAFPDLCDSLTVASGSGLGQHIYLHVDDMPPNKRRNGVEVRGNGCYTVCPPSIHPTTGKLYRLENNAPVLRVKNIAPVLRWLSPPPSSPPPSSPRPNGANDAWVSSAVMRELRNLRNAPQGNVNNTLNAVSYRLARICANPESGLDPHAIQSQIMNQVIEYRAHKGERAAEKTMLSGWGAGWHKPVSIPKARYGRGI